MIGMVLVSHGMLADEFGKALEHVVGKQAYLMCICINPDDDMAQRRTEIEDAITQTNNGDGVILFTDLFGGTPSNLAISCLAQKQVEVIAGLNLPMLIKLAMLRQNQHDVQKVANECCEAGKKHISLASNILAN